MDEIKLHGQIIAFSILLSPLWIYLAFWARKKINLRKLNEVSFEYIPLRVLDSRQWHEAGGILHTDIWVTLPDEDKTETKIHLTNVDVSVRKGHEIIGCFFDYHLICIYNTATKNVHPIVNQDVALHFFPDLLLKVIFVSLFLTLVIPPIYLDADFGDVIQSIVLLTLISTFPYTFTKNFRITRKMKPIWKSIDFESLQAKNIHS